MTRFMMRWERYVCMTDVLFRSLRCWLLWRVLTFHDWCTLGFVSFIQAFGNKQIVSETPLSMSQNWILSNDPAFNEHTSAFTNSKTRHVDAAYEFVFNNLAMLNTDSSNKRGQKSYVLLPNFLPTSATSFDRFAGQVSNIIRVMPSMAEKVMVSTFHPEHVVTSTRAPVPIVVLTWK